MQSTLPTPRSRSASSLAGAGLLIAILVLLSGTRDAEAVFMTGESAPSVAAPNCWLTGSKTIAVNRHVRVFRADTPLREVYGCRRNADRAYELGVSLDCQNYDEIDGAVVAGNSVALNVRTCSLYGSQSRVLLVRLRTGRVAFGASPLSTTPSSDDDDVVRDMVLTIAGRLAWTGVRTTHGAVAATEVRRRKHGSAKRAVLLDSGTDIAPRSLRRRGNRAIWLKGGVTRSSRF